MASAPHVPAALEEALTRALGLSADSCNDEQAFNAYRLALSLSWERMVLVVGPLGAKAIVEHSIKVASRERPQVALVTVNEKGADLSKLEANSAQADWMESCLSLKQLCLAVFRTLGELTGDVLTTPLLEELRLRLGKK